MIQAPDVNDMRKVVIAALDEDLRYGPDVTTTACVPQDAVAEADVVHRQAGVLAGIPAALIVLDEVLGEGAYDVLSCRSDGEYLNAGEVAMRLRAPARGLLVAERVALNLLRHLSGIATVTRSWVEAVEGTGAIIRDTRKTLPGLRKLQKYAVLCGGGQNHRFGLGDAAQIKDNHVIAAGSITAAMAAVRAAAPGVHCVVEVDSLEEMNQALEAGAIHLILDNFTPEQCEVAVRHRNAAGYQQVKFEVSGELRFEQARAFAEAGVDYLAAGTLTHSSPALDLSLDLKVSSSFQA
ncbi:carboxylating nicotinate-nucleotide diphosphorylase [Streptomyces sp. UNOC14_S4]|uniref:carboxylating nicotinate-nucleotide diphosphorylase n=1 Tax=Streptomyces sp. UNOC14_S4 TaxID=2872340 RepID=UPI001E39C462|nr:carboxylating nicotinate-nucleotide diphosphorylase [Streptomyces sp. UNOC14_S4]